MWCFLVYTGKNTVLQSSLITPDTPKTAAAVLELLELLFGCGCTLLVDNFFSSQELARKPKFKHSTDCVGTLKLNRKNVPKEMKDMKLEKGEIISRHSGPVTVLKWHEKSAITMVSTYHNSDTQRVSNKVKEAEKTLCVIDYNHNMGGSWFEGTGCCTCTWSRGKKKWPNGTSIFSKGYLTLKFSNRLSFIDK